MKGGSAGKKPYGRFLADELGGILVFGGGIELLLRIETRYPGFYIIFLQPFLSFEIRLLLRKYPVACDRYIYSTWVYYIVYGLNILKFFPVNFMPIIKPKIVVCLCANDKIRLKRMNLRKNNTKKDFDFQSLKKCIIYLCNLMNL